MFFAAVQAELRSGDVLEALLRADPDADEPREVLHRLHEVRLLILLSFIHSFFIPSLTKMMRWMMA